MDGVDRPLAQCFVVSDGIDVFIKQGDAAISALRQPGQGYLALVFDLGGAVEDIRRQAAELRAS
jgi:hypothetical protein